jgi:hypothetical protein
MDLAATSQQARDVLSAFTDPARVHERPALTAALRPNPADFALVFREEHLSAARAHFDDLWTQAPVLAPSPGTELIIATASSDDLVTGDAPAFPGGYRDLPLQPGRAWVAWKYVQPGESRGLAFDGLVHLGFRKFAWFPKPWRAFAKKPSRPESPYSE